MNHSQPAPTPYSLLRDPLYYATVVFFAFAATALPALLRAPGFLLIAQTIAFWLLLLVPLRRNSARSTLIVILIWIAVQAFTMFTLSMVAPDRLEASIRNGFKYHEALLAWLYTRSPLPFSWFSQPMARLFEVAIATLGALVSGGLLGVWILVRGVNLYAFGAGALVRSAGGFGGVMAALQPWFLLRLLGYAGLLPLLALPLFSGEWLPGRWSPGRRRLLLVAGSLFLAGFALEIFLPGAWATWFSKNAGL